MGIFGMGGKKKGDEAKAPASTRTGRSDPPQARPSRRVVSVGKTAPTGTPRPATERNPSPAGAATPQPPQVEEDDLQLVAPPPPPTTRPQPPATRVATGPVRKGTQPITASQKPAFSGDLAHGQRGSGPCRTGDAALLEFLSGKAKLIDAEQAGLVKAKAERESLPLDAAGVALGFFSEEQLVNALASEYYVPHLRVDRYEIRKKALDTITKEDAQYYGVFPVDKLGSLLTLAMINPLDTETLRVLEAKTGLDIKKVVATRSEIAQGTDKYYGGKVQAKDISIAITQDVEPRSVTQMLSGVASSSTTQAPPVMPARAPSLDVRAEVQDIDDLLGADEVIAPAIIEPAKPGEQVGEPLVIPAGEIIEVVEQPEPSALEAKAVVAPEFEGVEPPQTKTPPKVHTAEFQLDDEPQLTAEPAIAPPTRAVKAAPPPRPAPSAPAATPAVTATGRIVSTGAGGARVALVNLIPVMEEEFQHAITHGKAHVFEKWVGLQSRNRIINAVPVEQELEVLLAGLTPRQA